MDVFKMTQYLVSATHMMTFTIIHFDKWFYCCYIYTHLLPLNEKVMLGFEICCFNSKKRLLYHIKVRP